MHYWGEEGYLENARRVLGVKRAIVERVAEIDGLVTWPSDGPLLQIAAEGFDIKLVVSGMEDRGWRLLGVTNPPAIHLTLDVMEQEYLDQFLNDLAEIVDGIKDGSVTREGLLTYGGVAAESTAPKWLLSAMEIMEKKNQG